MKYLKIIIFIIILMLFIGGDVMADDFIQDDFIQIPSFLNENTNIDNEIISPMATCDGSCMDWCEHYDECCQYENCMGTCQTCLGCEGGCQSCQTTCESTCQTCLTSQSPATNATLTFSNITANSVRATLSGLDPNYPEYLRVVWFRGGTQIGIDEPVVTSSSINITGLSPNTSYLIRAEIYDTETHEFLDYLQKSVTTLSLPKLPTPTLDTTQTVKTGNSISVTINPVTGATTYYARINGGNQQSSSGRTFTFSGLQPNTQYFIEIKAGGTGYEDSNWAGYYATTLSAELWEWHTPKTTGAGFNVTRAEWIAFCEKINEVRVAKGLSAYSFTTSTTYIDKDKPFYAWIWLEAANAINQINGQVASACLNVNSGDNIYAWYFDNLKTALNNAISS
jgi:hypothetical protein